MSTTVTLRLDRDLQFIAETPSGHQLRLDSGPALPGGVAGPGPMQLLLVSLAGCGAMDVISILRKMREDVASYEVSATGERASEHPRVYTSIALTHSVTGAVDEANLARAIQLSISRYCPVFATLSPTTPIAVRYELHRPDGSVLSAAVQPESSEAS